MTGKPTTNVLATAGAGPTDLDMHGMALNAARKQLGIPKLDEKQLNLRRQENTSDGGAKFSLSEVMLPTAEGTSLPLNSNAPAFVVPVRSPFANGTLGIDSPTANSACLDFFQQQSLQYQMQQAYTPEQELYLTHNAIQHCSRATLLMVLSSVVDENPQLAPVVRQRCEKATLLLAQQHQQAVAAGRFVQHMSGGPWPGTHNNAPSNYESPRAPVYASSGSPHSGSTRKGRSAKNREEGLCSVHNSMRSMNHLQLNKLTGLFECVSGFHCLEDGGLTALGPNQLQNPCSPNMTSTHGNNPPSKPANRSVPQSGTAKDPLGSTNNDGSNCPKSSDGNSSGVRQPQEDCYQQASTKDGVPFGFGAELAALKNILQSVREMETKDS